MPIFTTRKKCPECQGCGKLVNQDGYQCAKFGYQIPQESIFTCKRCSGSGVVYCEEFFCSEYIDKKLQKGKSMGDISTKLYEIN